MPKTMKAMRLHHQGQPLLLDDIPLPVPEAGQVQVRVSACAVCRTDLHVCDGDLHHPTLPLVPGHEIVGYITACGDQVEGLQPGDRVGIPWLGYTCGACDYCQAGRENLCDNARFTGYQIDGGYAEYTVADQHFVFPINSEMSDAEVAPLLCAGLIGYRSYKMAGDARHIGIYGFGAAAHILAQVAVSQGNNIYAVTRDGDNQAQAFARELGASWSGGVSDKLPQALDAAIIFAPVGELVPLALKAVKKGGKVVCAGIHMSDIPCFAYDDLWGERSIESVANLTRQDGEEFFALLARTPVTTHVSCFDLSEANRALTDLRNGKINGAAVLVNACNDNDESP